MLAVTGKGIIVKAIAREMSRVCIRNSLSRFLNWPLQIVWHDLGLKLFNPE